MSTSNWRQLNGTWRRPEPTPRWRSRRAEALARPAQEPSLDAVLDVPYLMACFDRCRQKGQAPGPDGWRYSDFGRQELTRALAAVCDAIRRGAYVPPPSRVVEIPKRGGTRQLALDNIIHRVFGSAAEGVLTPALAPHMSRVTHSACGRGVHTLLRALHRAVTGGRYRVLVNHDVRSAFPSLPAGVAVHAFRAHVADRPLLGLIELLLRGADGLTRQIGIPQGQALSPLALDLSMSLFVDRLWPTSSDSPVALRYVDNLVFAAATVYEGRRTVDRCRTLLGRIGLTLKDVPEREHLCDLSEGETTELLGLTLYLHHGTLRFGIGTGALGALRLELTKAHQAPNPPLTSRSVITGWICAMGPAFDPTRSGALTDQVLDVARRHGQREISPESVRNTWEQAGRRWQHFLRQPPRTRTSSRS